ncbi:S-adenosyl-L-methionine-dependent methyltransferase [Hygrophoropsis aurantiaca]|uniref:S-adenosyl-L-methionine-dependent methyltransferase n=1 Tax=Hygrophoropsis aurantiaca TaxID=72124 RepID=A0ACB8A672_9AGAM|nr:S-adenosyl-L-methionine-dependent methyltransferase [Hygrophoropsis aurantiaca]
MSLVTDNQSLSSNYGLSHDEKEYGRLNKQHIILKEFVGANYLAPLDRYAEPGIRNILDLGCGTGLWALEMASEFPEADVIGIDTTLPRISAPRENCRFMITDITTRFSFEDNSFDVVQMRIVPSLANRENILQEIWRVLRPGGFVLFLEPAEIFSGATQSRPPSFLEEDRLLSTSPHRGVAKEQNSDFTWSIAFKLAEILRDAKDPTGNALFGDVQEKRFEFPVGAWPTDERQAKFGKMIAETQVSLLEGFREMLLTNGIVTEEEFSNLLKAIIAETNDVSLQLQIPYVYAWGRKTHT